jgi:peptide deformylase
MFTIAKWDHTKEEGIYKVSAPVRRFSEIKDTVFDMVKWLNDNNGKFEEPYTTAYAVSHCQVEANPYHFFIVSKDLVGDKKKKEGRNTSKNYFFPSQIIVNAEVIDTPEKITVNKPMRRIVRGKDGKVTPKIEIKETVERNGIFVPEACMSFRNRTKKNMERFYRVTVRYQIPKKILGVWYLSTKTEVVEGLKSHIFQHETDHAKAKNMYYGK